MKIVITVSHTGPVAGSLQVEPAPEEAVGHAEFVGWIELLSILGRLLEHEQAGEPTS